MGLLCVGRHFRDDTIESMREIYSPFLAADSLRFGAQVGVNPNVSGVVLSCHAHIQIADDNARDQLKGRRGAPPPVITLKLLFSLERQRRLPSSLT